MESVESNRFLQTNANSPDRYHEIEMGAYTAPGYYVDTQKLKAVREEAGLTVAELAAGASVDEYELALVEKQGYVPALTTLRKITLALQIPAHTVIEWTQPSVWRGPQEYST